MTRAEFGRLQDALIELDEGYTWRARRILGDLASEAQEAFRTEDAYWTEMEVNEPINLERAA